MRTIRRTPKRLIGPAAAAIAVAAPAAFAVAPAVAAPPAELPPLIAKMKALQVSSERFTATVAVHARRLPKDLAILRALTIHLSGEGTLTSPQSATIDASVAGHSTTVRQIGTLIYTYVPKLASKDGGKPWVMSTVKSETSLDAGPGLPSSSDAPYAQFGSLLEAAHTGKALGPVTVDGQATTSFALGGIDVAKLGELNAKTRALLRRKHIVPRAKLVVDLNAEGLPVHTTGAISLGKVSVDFTTDLLAIDFPLTVAAPAPTETITAAEVLALIKKSSHHK